MTSRASYSAIISTGAAFGAMIVAAPALAQGYTGPEMTYEERGYEYAQPAPAAAPQTAPVTYRQEAVVQPLPERPQYAQPMPSKPVRYVKDRAGADYQVPHKGKRQVAHAPQYRAAKQHAPAYHAPRQAAPVYTAQHSPRHAPRHVKSQQHVTYPMHHQQQPGFDRAAWMDECIDRVDGHSNRKGGNGGVVGGLVGAAAGGVIGNRIAGRGNRLAGSLIGAGVGGLAGLAVGSASDRSSRRGNDEAYAYCEDWLARYSGGYGYQQHGYAYQHARPMMMVPVWVQVPQRAVTREYVTYEYEDVEVVTYEDVPARRRVIHTPAPKPVYVKEAKPTYVKQAKPVRYTKGK